MSTGYNFGKSIPISELDRLEKYGITRWKPAEDDHSSEAEAVRKSENIILTQTTEDGKKNFVHCGPFEGMISEMTRFGGNDEEAFVEAIEMEFKVVVVSEYDEDNYGAPLYAQWRKYGEGPCPCCGKMR